MLFKGADFLRDPNRVSETNHLQAASTKSTRMLRVYQYIFCHSACSVCLATDMGG